jgi:hypothetical protein
MINQLIKKIIFSLTVFLFLCPITSPVFGRDFKSDYKVEYFLKEEVDNHVEAQVKYEVSITNLRSDVYISQFSLSFPKSFPIKNILAHDDNGQVQPEVVTDDEKIKIKLSFSKPAIGKDKKNSFYLSFYQANLFKVNGNIWEVMIPTLTGEEYENYQVIVYLPKETEKKISIAKPLPAKINKIGTETQIIWQNPPTRTIYAIFGEGQFYQTQLTYYLNNPNPLPAYIELAFPPDTLYQKIFVQNISPKPAQIYSDLDGNFLARYFLYPKETKQILFEGVIAVYPLPRQEVIPIVKKMLEQQKKYLLTQKSYWQIENLSQLPEVNQPRQIYNYVIDRLQYDFKQVEKRKKRLGANNALSNPNLAACTEYTDLFIALAREKGIMAREIQGYGFSWENFLRPISLVSDVLHAWPEYYDQKEKLWIPIDPTWEDTSGIDYFYSFDVNHIAFVIHGKEPDYPVPAGMYKIGDSKAVQIVPTKEKPTDDGEIVFEASQFPTKIYAGQKYNGKILIKNSTNTYQWGINFSIAADWLSLDKKTFSFNFLLPGEEKIIPVSFYAPKIAKPAVVDLTINFMGKKYKQVMKAYPFYYQYFKYLFIFVIGCSFIFFIRHAFFHHRG